MQLITVLTTILAPITPSSLSQSNPSSLSHPAPASHVSHPHYSTHNTPSTPDTHQSHSQAQAQTLISTTDFQNYGLIAIRPGTPLQNQAIVANGQRFWVGKKTASYCPLDSDACPPGTDTYLAGGDETLALNVMVPGGQQVYIAPGGALAFTQAHSAYIPPGSIIDGFYRDNGRLYWENGFSACPSQEDGDDVWQIFANVDDFEGDGCTGILTQEIETSGPYGAWQYT